MEFAEDQTLQSKIEMAMSQEYDPVASSEDILSCFRILLGRQPIPGEWPGHALQAGHDLESVVESYLNSLEFSRRKLTRNDKEASMEIIKSDRFRIYADSEDPLIGIPVINGKYEPEIVSQFEQILQPGMAVLDIGANIGYFSMLAASLVGPQGFVLAVEPNAANARMLEASRRLNGFEQITILHAAASSQVGLLAFHATHSTGVTSPLPAGDPTIFDGNLVPGLPIDRIITTDRKIDLIKIDVDGSEYHALQGVIDLIRRDQPIIITEFYPDGLLGLSGIDGYAYLQWLAELGYRLSVIEYDGSTSAIDNPDQVARVLAARGSDHLDLLCRPVARAAGSPDALSQISPIEENAKLEGFVRVEQRCRDLGAELGWIRMHLESANLHARDAERRARDAMKENTAAFMRSSAAEGAMSEMRKDLGAANMHAQDAERRARDAAHESTAAFMRAAAAEGALSEMRKELEASGIREHQALSHLTAFQTSSSWQLTGPLRAAVGALRRFRKGRPAGELPGKPAEPSKPAQTSSISLSEIVNPERYDDPEWAALHADLERYANDKHCFTNVTGEIYRKGWEWTHCLYGLRKLGMLKPEHRALGVGVGREPVIFYLADHISEVVATDLYGGEGWSANGGKEADPAMLEQARQSCPASVDLNKITFENQDGTALSYQDAEFDFCWSLSSIEHFGGHSAAVRALQEMSRVVRTGGIIALATELLLSEGYRHPEYFTRAELMNELIAGCTNLKLLGPVGFDTLPQEYLLDSIVVPAGADRRRRHVVLNDGDVQWTSVMLFFEKR